MDNETRARLFLEYRDLQERIDSLESFILGEAFEDLPDYDRHDLKQQRKHMRAYLAVLERRVSRQCNNA